MLSASHAPRFRAIVGYWNSVEREIKRCELLQANVAIAAINELRYAGRRLADALMYAMSTPADLGLTQQEIDDRLHLALVEAEQYCQRAHHDAIDSAVFFVRRYIDLLEKRVKPATLVVVLPDYLALRATLADVIEVISVSRERRHERATYYQEIADIHLPALVKAHKTLETSKEIIFKLKRRQDIMFWSGIAGWALALPSIYSAFAAYYHIWPFRP